MSDTVAISVDRDAWTNISLAESNGLFTNNRRSAIRYRQATSQPTADDNFGHVLNPGESSYFYLPGGATLWAKGVTQDSVIAVTGGIALTKDGFFSRDFICEVNQGKIPGYEMVHKFGFNGTVGGTFEHIWNATGDLVWQTTATQYELLSTNAGDNAGGSGVRSVFAEMLLSDFTSEIIETAMHPTDGTIAVLITGSHIRLNRAWIGDVGTYTGFNLGDITIRQISAGNIQGFIETGEGQTQKCQFTVPAGKTGYIRNSSMTVLTTQTTNVRLLKREDADVVAAPFTGARIMHQWDGLVAPYNEEFKANHVIPEKTDVWMEALVSAGPASVEANYEILLVDN